MNLESNQGEQPESCRGRVGQKWRGIPPTKRWVKSIPTDWILRYFRLLLIDYRLSFFSLLFLFFYFFLFLFFSLFVISHPRATELVDELESMAEKDRENAETCIPTGCLPVSLFNFPRVKDK
ncbi:hypothetical protein BO85DRAFT_80734 [Aspergillus piperis CBS 112811]|uniref:Uncharacterized protein n=1 Tax=Aspergillus piperis CBS 112811 TaxID=1448313 RepID=A0A8G1QX30_9EURO|nr:hypothetical protein BO85DRAFT_80734 [Aspergillus piperis CBS 112811]RAH55157.1 hypothetical protein BO85DRAFT_80734 [Aspergillus piperis CBS 112811]